MFPSEQEIGLGLLPPHQSLDIFLMSEKKQYKDNKGKNDKGGGGSIEHHYYQDGERQSGYHGAK